MKTMRFSVLLAGLLAAMNLSAQQVIVEDQGTSGIDDDGALFGTAVITADSVYGSGAVDLPPGDGNYVGLTQPVTDLDMGDAYTYMTWFKNTTAGQKGLIGLGNCCTANGGDPRNGYTMNITSSPGIRYWAGSTDNDSNHNEYINSEPAINDGEWHHVAIRVQEGQVDIFFDGVLRTAGTESNIPTQPSLASVNALSTNVPKIGGDGISESSTAQTVIDEVRVYGCNLSDQEIVDAMNNNLPPPDRLYYPFDNDTQVVVDPGFVCEGTRIFVEDSVPVPLFSRTALAVLAILLMTMGLVWVRRRRTH